MQDIYKLWRICEVNAVVVNRSSEMFACHWKLRPLFSVFRSWPKVFRRLHAAINLMRTYMVMLGSKARSCYFCV